MAKDKIKTVKPIREQIVSILRKRIIKGEYAPGQLIVEREVSAELGISATPVKEAFRILETEGILTSLPRIGTVVSEFARQNFEHTTIILSAMEGVAARLATEALSDSEVLELSILLKSAKDFLDSEDLESAVRINAKFHRNIRAATKNRYLVQMIETLYSYEQEFRYQALQDLNQRRIGYEEHLSILEAIRVRDCDLAETRMRNHVRRSALHIISEEIMQL